MLFNQLNFHTMKKSTIFFALVNAVEMAFEHLVIMCNSAIVEMISALDIDFYVSFVHDENQINSTTKFMLNDVVESITVKVFHNTDKMPTKKNGFGFGYDIEYQFKIGNGKFNVYKNSKTKQIAYLGDQKFYRIVSQFVKLP